MRAVRYREGRVEVVQVAAPQGDGGGPVCTAQPPTCAAEFEKCTVDSDCCGVNQGMTCVNGLCTYSEPPVP